MPADKKTGRITLRMDPATHGRAAGTAKALGMGINDLLNLIIREGLIKYEMEAQMLRKPETIALLELWQRLNPSREIPEFFADYYTLMQGKAVRFENGKRYVFFGDELEPALDVLLPKPEGFREIPPASAVEAGGDAQTGNEDDIPF